MEEELIIAMVAYYQQPHRYRHTPSLIELVLQINPYSDERSGSPTEVRPRATADALTSCLARSMCSDTGSGEHVPYAYRGRNYHYILGGSDALEELTLSPWWLDCAVRTRRPNLDCALRTRRPNPTVWRMHSSETPKSETHRILIDCQAWQD